MENIKSGAATISRRMLRRRKAVAKLASISHRMNRRIFTVPPEGWIEIVKETVLACFKPMAKSYLAPETVASWCLDTAATGQRVDVRLKRPSGPLDLRPFHLLGL